jgi:hypothetical protein
VTTETAEIAGYLSRADAVALQDVARDYEQRGEAMRCIGKLIGDQQVGVWLNLPHLREQKTQQATVENVAEYSNLDVCREVFNVADLIGGRRPYSRSRPNWAGSRVAAIGEERYFANLERVSRGRCETGERIRLKAYLIPDRRNPVDSDAVIVTTKQGDVLGYLPKAHASRWGAAIRAFFDSGRVICRDAGLHQRTFKSGKRQFYLTVELTDAEWLEGAAERISLD